MHDCPNINHFEIYATVIKTFEDQMKCFNKINIHRIDIHRQQSKHYLNKQNKTKLF